MRRWIAGLFTATSLGGGALYGADKAVNPYDDKGTHYELDIKADIEQGERVEIAKDKAAMTLKGWNDEYAITVTPQIPTVSFGADKDIDRSFKTQADRNLLSKKMEFREGDVTAFVEPKAGTENEFDIDFTLHAKPDTNVFTYKIEGAEDFDFFYQPELTPEEIAEGATQPENVVGSYAVYHKTKANHRIGSTNYATGKAFHIYRPKALDANGAEVWAELSYESGTLSVTVSENWLKTATYPVRVDPTFGYTTQGASSAAFVASQAVGSYINSTVTASGEVDSIHIYCSRDVFGNIKGFIVDSSEAILTNGVTPSDTCVIGASWIILPYSTKPAVTGGSAYRPYIVFETSNNVFRDAGGSSGDSKFESDNSYTTPTNPSGLTNSASRYSIYATYSTDPCGAGETCTDTYGVPGYNTWTAPSGVTQAIAACWGAGGGGGIIATNAGAGGGGGAFASSTLTVTAGTTYGLWIGERGIADSGAWARESSFATSSCPDCVIASGGSGADPATNTTNGLGGPTASSTGQTEFAGGDGGDGNTTGDIGGGGGGSAGPHGAGGGGAAGYLTSFRGGGGGGGNGGTTATTDAGGTSTNGGAGGTGGNGAIGAAGTINSNGGGGGGGGDDTFAGGSGGLVGGGGGGAEVTGGSAGGSGQCTITYTVSGGGGGSPAILEDIIFFD